MMRIKNSCCKTDMFFQLSTILMFFFLLIACECESGMESRQITNIDPADGTVYSPRMVWNGTDFGIAYLLWDQSLYKGDIHILQTDTSGNVIRSVAPTGANIFTQLFSMMSDLVWNPDDNQYAFAYFNKQLEGVYFQRLGANLEQIYPPVRIEYPECPHDVDPMFYMEELSLVWNTARREYGLSYIMSCAGCHGKAKRDHPRDDIYFQRILADGTLLDGSRGRHIGFSAPYSCFRSAMSFNSKNGKYAISYFKDDYSSSDLMVCFLGKQMQPEEYKVSPGQNYNGTSNIRICYDYRMKDFFVVSNLSPGFRGWVIKEDGTSVGNSSKNFTGQFSTYFSIANYLGGHVYLVSASDGFQIHCWLATQSYQAEADLMHTPGNSVHRMWPSLSIVDDMHPYVSWVENNQIFLGPVE
jgi:hypothetical protein